MKYQNLMSLSPNSQPKQFSNVKPKFGTKDLESMSIQEYGMSGLVLAHFGTFRTFMYTYSCFQAKTG